MTTPLMTAAEMRTYLIEKRAADLADAKQAAEKKAERVKVWAQETLGAHLELLRQGDHSTYERCEEHEAAALIELATSLGYAAARDDDDEGVCVVVMAPALETPERMRADSVG
jgi:hypothetical protein